MRFVRPCRRSARAARAWTIFELPQPALAARVQLRVALAHGVEPLRKGGRHPHTKMMMTMVMMMMAVVMTIVVGVAHVRL